MGILADSDGTEATLANFDDAEARLLAFGPASEVPAGTFGTAPEVPAALEDAAARFARLSVLCRLDPRP